MRVTSFNLQSVLLIKNELERNNMKFPTVSVNTKFLNSLQPEWLKYVTQVCLAKRLTVDSFDDLFDYLLQFEKLVNASRAKKLEKSHDPLALVAHTGSSSRNTSSYYVTHPSSVVDYDEEYEHDFGRNNRRAYVQEEVVEGMNATNETVNVQRIVRTPTPGNTSTGQCYNCGGKGHYARNCPKPRVQDSKYFQWSQVLLAKQDEAGVRLTDEQNDYLFVDASRMEEIEELSANICLMARIQPADQNFDDDQAYFSPAFKDTKILLKLLCTPKIRNAEKATQSNTLDTTFEAFQNQRFDEASASKARDKVVPDLSMVMTVLFKAYDGFTWVYFLRSKDETPEIIKKFITQAQLNYKAKVCKIRTDNGTEFKNATLKA
ncbi:integrase, catalytic region, zinc finger, CCHC-type containing protein [Tanacetum coccineum]